MEHRIELERRGRDKLQVSLMIWYTFINFPLQILQFISIFLWGHVLRAPPNVSIMLPLLYSSLPKCLRFLGHRAQFRQLQVYKCRRLGWFQASSNFILDKCWTNYSQRFPYSPRTSKGKNFYLSLHKFLILSRFFLEHLAAIYRVYFKQTINYSWCSIILSCSADFLFNSQMHLNFLSPHRRLICFFGEAILFRLREKVVRFLTFLFKRAFLL